MVPVELQLKNFLSYGTEAPSLDFGRFEVACLSGKNGQGKSALLDAMTWAIWGEARKSSGRRKPDEELIRIGTRHMEVTFVFDIEGDRYRVTRSFSRSATGKTTTSELEFQIYVPDADAYRPLTGADQRETQQVIEDTLGLDYDTFINSAFLLQGRSDEFTKKRPSERKDILARILNLSRYEGLAGMARDKWRAAKDRQEQAEAEIERLQEALEGAPGWRDERAELEAEIAAQQEQLDALRAEEKKLTGRRADLDAKAREATSIRQSIQGIEARIEQLREDAKQLEHRIKEAEALIAQREAIQAAYDRYETLQAERDALDEKRDLHRGVEKQIEQKQSAIKDKKNEFEKRLERLDVEHKSLKKDLETCVQKLAQRPVLREKRNEAKTAASELEQLSVRRERARTLDEQLATVEQQIVGRREALRGKLQELREQIQAREQEIDDPKTLTARVEALEAKVEQREKLETKREAVQERGTVLSNAVSERVGELEARRTELEKQEADFARFREAGDGVCPTCGTELTESHRREVETSYQRNVQALTQRIEDDKAVLQSERKERAELRDSYRRLTKKMDALAEAPEQLATAREQLRAQQQKRMALKKSKEQAAKLKNVLAERHFAVPQRKRRQALRQRRAAYHVDAGHYERVQNAAAQLERYEERLRELEEYAGRKEQLERRIEKHQREAEALRDQLDDGQAFGALRDQIEQLQQQLTAIDFDPDRFDEVRAELRTLSDAGSRMQDLVNAQKNREDWNNQRKQIGLRTDKATEEKHSLQEKLKVLREELDAKDGLDKRQRQKAEQVSETEQELNEMRQRLGELTARLTQASKDRVALKEAKQRHADAKRERALYRHLRKAFGKHGIPSLIIEETLPEIEERANVLLDRLTDGKMHVRLETLRDKKTGGTKETLEIIITDEQGVPRPYETFSGGESFRVNFALRIALAQLLAERSGVRIRTLVIDEGFGTQDADGIERLVESIETIREDFARIIVITHLERFKQVFPVRIEVEKDPVTGSSFELMGAG